MKRRRSSFTSLVPAALAVPALLMLTVSCDGQGGLNGGAQEDAQSLLGQAHIAMRSLDSYHATMATYGEGIAGSGLATEYEWAAPNRYRSLTPMVNVEGTGTCGRHRAGQPLFATCTDIRSEIPDGYVEIILIGSRTYSQSCREKGSQCEQWETRDAGPLALMGVSLLRAEWTITALTALREAEIVGEETVSGEPVIRLGGTLNLTEVYLSTFRAAAEAGGIETVGEECVEGGEPVPEGETPTIIPTPQCRPVTVEDFLAHIRDTMESRGRREGSAEMWIGREDHLMRRFTVSVPPADPSEPRPETVVEFSGFNEVVIKAPR